MTVLSILELLGISPAGGILLALFVLSGLLEFSKIKINPWSALGKLIRNVIMKDTTEALNQVINSQKKMEKDLSEHIAQSHRQAVVSFTTECLNDQRHTKEQFDYVFKAYRYYEKYVKENNMTNDEVTESIAYIRRIYQKCLDDRDFEK